MAGRLDTAISNVDPESLPESGTNPTAPEDPTPEAASGKKGGKGTEGDKDGRTVDNVRGELMRKMEKEREYFTDLVRSLEGKIEQLSSVAGPAKPAKAKGAPDTLDDLSIAELKTLRANVPEEQRAAFEEYFEERRVREQVETQVKAITNKQTFAQQEKTATTQALTRWPDLRDSTSELYRATNKVLNEMGQMADSNPRAILDAANEAGMQLGLSPRTGQTRRMRTVKSTAPGATDAPTDGDDLVDTDELNRLAAKFASSTKDGKFSKEQMERIAKNAAEYRRHQHLLVK
jgi:hypothetical protein